MMKQFNQFITTLALAMPFSISAQALSVKKMDTSELFSSTLNSVPDCIEYCIDGISLYAIPTPWGFTYYWTLNVSHNSPDLVMMSYNDIRESPWEEFDNFFGENYASFTESLLQKITGLSIEVGGGRIQHKGWGHHQTVSFKEAAGLGHPAAVILKMFDQGGLKPASKPGNRGDREPCLTNGCLEDESGGLGNSIRQETGSGGTGNQSTNDWLTSFMNGGNMNTTPDMVSGFGGNMSNINSAANNKGLNSFMEGLGNRVNGQGMSTGQRLFCPINITPFMPYYLSGLDALEWRSGYPITDWKHSATILNPLSRDVIETFVKDTFTINGKKYSAFSVNESWGNLYPREGTLNQPWDSKRATVIIARAADILIENNSSRVRYKPGNSNNGFGGWGKIFPIMGDTTPGQTEAACHKNVANTGTTINETGGYAWTFWRRYNCDLRTTGIHIVTVKFPSPICLTSEVPQ